MKPLNMALKSYNDIFETDKSRSSEEVIQIPLSELKPFANQPFKVLNDESMEELKNSVKANGVLSPITVRPLEGGYEILSGHRRVTACRAIGIDSVPSIVKDLDDDTAKILLVDSNLQRENILPSEKAFAYKMKLEAIKRKNKKSSVVQIGQNSRQELAEQTGESSVQVQRYLRLTNLTATFLDMADEKKIPVNAGVELSYLDEDAQNTLSEVMEDICADKLSIAQAVKIRKAYESDGASYGTFADILTEQKKDKAKISFKTDTIRHYFPESYSAEDMENTLIELLKRWSSRATA